MSSPATAVPSLPIIDISPFLSPTSSETAQSETAQALYAACHDVGFFYLTGHGIPEKTQQAVLNAAREFFLNASEEEKATIARREVGEGGDGARGWQKLGENVTGVLNVGVVCCSCALGKEVNGKHEWDSFSEFFVSLIEPAWREDQFPGAVANAHQDWHEAIDFYQPPAISHPPPYAPIKGPNLYPSRPANFCSLYKSYVSLLHSLGLAVMRAMALALSSPDPFLFTRYTDSSFWILRAIGYPPLPPGTTGASCGAHTDYGCTTFLLADDTTGALQVQAKDGGWISADPVRGAYVVNIGDMMERWTNGLWKSTVHRVIHRGGTYRVSVPFFFEPNWDARVEPLQICLDRTGGVPKYEATVYGEHLLSKVAGNFYKGNGEQ